MRKSLDDEVFRLMPAFRFSACTFLASLVVVGWAGVVHARELKLSGAETSLSGNYLAGRLASRERDADAASAFFGAALRADPQNPELLERAFLWMLAEGSVEQSMTLADRVVKQNPSSLEARLALAVRAIKAEQYPSARTQLAQGLRGALADLTTSLLIAWTQVGSGDPKRGIQTGDQMKGTDWVGAFRDYNVGLMADISGNAKKAEEELKTASATDRSADRPVLALARLYARQGDKEKALSTLATLDEGRNHPVVKRLSQEITEGKPVQPLVGDVKQGAAEVLYGIGSTLARERGEELATVYLRLALYLTPRFDMAQASLGDLYQRLEQYDRAIQAYEAIPEESPLRARAAINAALALDRLDRTDDAIQKLETQVAASPSDYDALVGLGRILGNRKRFADAAEVYTKAVSLLPDGDRSQWSLFYLRGMAYERSKQWDKAEADLKKALELSPDQASVLNYLGYSWVDQGRNLDQGLDMIRRAVELQPDDGYIVDSLGWAYYRLGRYEEAVGELERAVELRPQDSVLNDHLGDAYWKIGRKLEARFQWTHARELDPEPEDLLQIDAKLKNGLVETPTNAAEATDKPNGG